MFTYISSTEVPCSQVSLACVALARKLTSSFANLVNRNCPLIYLLIYHQPDVSGQQASRLPTGPGQPSVGQPAVVSMGPMALTYNSQHSDTLDLERFLATNYVNGKLTKQLHPNRACQAWQLSCTVLGTVPFLQLFSLTQSFAYYHHPA